MKCKSNYDIRIRHWVRILNLSATCKVCSTEALLEAAENLSNISHRTGRNIGYSYTCTAHGGSKRQFSLPEITDVGFLQITETKSSGREPAGCWHYRFLWVLAEMNYSCLYQRKQTKSIVGNGQVALSGGVFQPVTPASV